MNTFYEEVRLKEELAGMSIAEIGMLVKKDAKNWQGGAIHYAAKPYVDAMCQLRSIGDKFYYDDGEDIVLRFLVNAGPWRGPVARTVKKHLKRLMREHERRRR